MEFNFTDIYRVKRTGHESCLSAITRHPGGYQTYKLTREDPKSPINWYFGHDLELTNKSRSI